MGANQKLGKTTSFMNFQPMSFDEKLRRYRAIFDSIDVDGSGTLDPEELVEAVAALGMDKNSVTDVFGVDGMHALTFEQFVEAMEAYEQQLSQEMIAEEEDDDEEFEDDDSMEGAVVPVLDIETATAYRRLFDDLDIKREGRLTAEGIHSYIRNLSLREANLSSEELNFYFALVEEADNSADGFVDIEGFADCAEFHHDFMDTYKDRSTANAGYMSNRVSHISVNSRASRRSARFSNIVPGSDMALFRQVFDEFDQNKTGLISDTDVTQMMNKLGRVPTEEESEFLFELLQLVGEDGFTFEEFVELMDEGAEGIAELGKNISTWKNRQTHQQQVKSRKLVKANFSRIGLRTAIQREDSRIQARNSATLERIKGRISSDSNHRKSSGASGFSFMPNNGMGGMGGGMGMEGSAGYPGGSGGSGGYPGGSGVPMYHAPAMVPGHKSGGNLVFASAMLGPLELLRYHAVFNALDLDKDGRITFAEMTLSTKGVTGRQPTDEEVRVFLQNSDIDSNGTLEFEEFVVAMQKTKRGMGRMTVPNSEFAMAASKRKMDKYRTVFENFDENKDGMISPDELVSTLKKMGKTPDENSVQNIFATYDRANRGGLMFEDFVPFLDKLVQKEMNL